MAVIKLAMSPDRRTVAVGTVHRRRILLVDVRSGTVRKPAVDGFGFVQRIAFSADSRHAALSLEDGRVAVLDVRTAKTLGVPFSALSTIGTALAFEPDGRRLLAGGTDGTIARLATTASPAIATTSAGPTSGIVKLTPDGNQLATSADGGGVELRPLRRGRFTQTLGTAIVDWDIALSGDGRTVAATVSEGTVHRAAKIPSVHVWRLPHGDPVVGIPAPEGHPPTAIALNRDGTVLAIGAGSGRLALWRLSSRGASPLGLPLRRDID
jgi:WD40 repeat protein